MNSNDDLLRREDVVDLIKARCRYYDQDMFATKSEYNIARIVALECANDVQDMPAYKEAGDE